MEDSKWYEGVEKEIKSLKEKMSKNDFEIFEVERFGQVAKKVAKKKSAKK